MMTNGLTKLVLDNGQYHHLRDLLDYLEHCENLEHLKIELPNLHGIAPASRIVSLRNLRKLELVRSPPTALHHLSFPPSTDLTIQSDTMGYQEYPLVDIWAQYRPFHIFESRTIKDIKMTFTGPGCVVGFSGSHLALTVEARTNPFLFSSFHSDCLNSFQSLPIKTVESFEFAQPPPYLLILTGTPRQQSCTRLLTQMPALERIALDIAAAPFFIRALEPGDGDLLCPKLQEFILIQRVGEHEVDVWNSLLTLSNQRKDHGHPIVCSVASYDSLNPGNIVRPERVV